MTIDDERVIALLHETVPNVPELPDRVAAIRRRAGRQRAAMWTQTIGAAAAVVVLVGMVAAVAAPRGGTVRPTREPLADLASVMSHQRSVAFDITMEPAGPIKVQPGFSVAQATAMLTGHATGAIAANGEGHVDGNMSPLFLGELAGSPNSYSDMHIVSVGGFVYRPLLGEETSYGHGKKWVREDAPPFTPTDIEHTVKLATAFADDVHYVRSSVLRGTQVAEYAFTIPGRFVGGTDIPGTFALDREGRPREITADFDLSRLFGVNDPDGLGVAMAVHVRLDLFGYGDPVSVTAPPASQVITSDELQNRSDTERDAAYTALTACMARAKSAADSQACHDAFQHAMGGSDCHRSTPAAPSSDPGMVCTFSSTVVATPVPTPGSGSGWTGYPPSPPPAPDGAYTLVTAVPSPR